MFIRLSLLFVFSVLSHAAVIGIDLSPSRYHLLVFSGGKKTDPGEILKERRTAPMCISLTEDERAFGDSSVRLFSTNPGSSSCAYFAYFREGKNATDRLKEFRSEFASLETWETRQTGESYISLGTETYNSEELTAMLLESFQKSLESHMKPQTLDFAISIPAFFTRSQRISFLQIAEAMNVKVLGLVHRNAAAALAFGIGRFDNETAHQAVVVYVGEDGVETALARFNATNKKTVKIKNVESVEILANSWNHSCSTHLFLSQLSNRLSEAFFLQYQIPLPQDSVTQTRLFQQSIAISQAFLGLKDEYQVYEERIHAEKTLKYTMKSKEFKEIIEKNAAGLMESVETVLREGNSTAEDINSVILTGPGANNFAVQDLLRVRFGKKASLHILDDIDIARGAGLYAANISSQYQLKPIWLTDVSSHLVKVDFSSLNDSDNFNRSLSLFKPGTRFGAKRQLSFTHDQSVKCLISTVENGLETPLFEAETTGVEEFIRKHGLKPTQVFTFEYSHNGIPGLLWAEARAEILVPESEPQNKTEEKNAGSEETKIDEKNETETKNETSPGMRKKIVRMDLEVKKRDLDVTGPLSMGEIKALAVRLRSLDDRDHDNKLVFEEKQKLRNQAKAFKDLLQDKGYQEVTRASEREELGKLIGETETWLSSPETRKAGTWNFTEKLTKLQSFFKDSQERLSEFKAFPEALKSAFLKLTSLNATMTNLNYTKTWIPQKDKDEVFLRLQETKEWLLKLEKEQKEKQPWEPPVVKVSLIESKVSGAAKNVERIQKTGRPKPKLVKEKKETAPHESVSESKEEAEDKSTQETAEEEAPHEEKQEFDPFEPKKIDRMPCSGEKCEDSETIERTEL